MQRARDLILCLALAAVWVWVWVGTAGAAETARVQLADGFEFPVGMPFKDETGNGLPDGYYKARGWWPGGHHGEDWNGLGGGNTDLGDPVYSIGRGLVVHSHDHGRGWGNVVIIRHAYQDRDGRVNMVDSLYGHLHQRFVQRGQTVERSQKVGTIGTGHGRFWAHLHLELRRNINIGMNRSAYPNNAANYLDPTKFIVAHRNLAPTQRRVEIPTHCPQGRGDVLAQEGPQPGVTSIDIPRLSEVEEASVDAELRRRIQEMERERRGGGRGGSDEPKSVLERLRESIQRKGEVD